MWSQLKKFLSRSRAPGLDPTLNQCWILVPLGNPGDEYVATRHNLGRLLLQRWADSESRKAERIRSLSNGNLYRLMDFLVLMPSTFMNLSGQTCAEAIRLGLKADRMILLHDDKDLPLGTGRLKLDGGDAGHNGLASIFEHLGTRNIARLRLGIGPFHRPLHQFVLGEWTDEEWETIEKMDGPFSDFLKLLASDSNLQNLLGLVNAPSFWIRG